MELGNIVHIVVIVHLHQVVACQRITRFPGFGQIQAMLPLGNHLAQNIDPIIGAVKEQFAIAALGNIFHPWARQLKSEQVTHHAFVGVWGQQGPIIVLAKPQNLHFTLL